MTSLDKALIKVYEHGHAPKKRRPVDVPESNRELYVDPPSDRVPNPPLASQVAVEVNDEPSIERPTPESLEHPTPESLEYPTPESTSFVTGDMTSVLESFVVQQQFDIPVLEEMGTVIADQLPSQTLEQPTASPSGEFKPAWEVDAFELPDSSVRMNDQLRQQLNDFASHLMQTMSDEKKLVTIHSQSRGEGRTTLCITLATALAQSGARVMVVDADFNNPALAHKLGLAVEIGWEKAIAGEVPIAECSVRSIGDAFTILPLADEAAGEDHSILRDALRNLLAELVTSFDLILIDTGPGQPVLCDIFDNMIGTRVAVRDVRRTDSRLMLQFMSSLKTRADLPVDAVDNFA